MEDGLIRIEFQRTANLHEGQIVLSLPGCNLRTEERAPRVIGLPGHDCNGLHLRYKSVLPSANKRFPNSTRAL